MQRIRNEYESAYRRENLLAANYASQARLVSEQAAQGGPLQHSQERCGHQPPALRLHAAQRPGSRHHFRPARQQHPRGGFRPWRLRGLTSRKLVLNAALGLLAGALFGFVFVVMRERADRSIQAPGEASLSLGVPELGVIPSLDAERSRYFSYYHKGKGQRGRGFEKHRPAAQIELITCASIKPSVVADCLPLHRDVHSVCRGEWRSSARDRAHQRQPGGRARRRWRATWRLALAEIGRPVLLIDGDLRKGRLHEIFKVSNAWGLSDLLAGKEPPAGREKRMWARATRVCRAARRGTPDSSIASLLHSPRATEFLDRMREEFHTVIIDSPPMLQMAGRARAGRRRTP